MLDVMYVMIAIAFFARELGLRERMRPVVRESLWNTQSQAVVSILLAVYLVYALLRPERF